MTPPGDGVTPVLFAVGLLIAGALATAVFGWMTSRKSVAITELETALEYMRGEAAQARELRTENWALTEQVEQLKKELSDVRSVALGLQRQVTELQQQMGGHGA